MVLRALSLKGLALLLAVFGATATPAHERHGAAAAVPVSAGTARQAPMPIALGGPFSLVDHTGTPRSDADFRGSYLLVFFGYADCDGICPMALPNMLGALDALGAAGRRIQPLFVSVAPAGDTSAALRAFVEKLHPRLIGLTGAPEKLRALARAYKAEAKIVGRFPDGKPIIAHGSFVYLVGPDGRFVTLFPPVMAAPAMAAAIRRYLPER